MKNLKQLLLNFNHFLTIHQMRMQLLKWTPLCQLLLCPLPPLPPKHPLPPPGPPPTFTSGSSSRSSSTSPTSTRGASTGSTGRKVFSRLSIPLGWPICGESEKIVRPWITTSYRDHSGSITRKESWRRRRGLKDSSTSSAHPTTCKNL